MLTLVSIPFVPLSISPAYCTQTHVQTELQMAAVPHSLTWCTAEQRSEIHCDQYRPTGQEKTVSSYVSTSLRAGTECDFPTHKPVGYQPHCAHTPSAEAENFDYGIHLRDSFPILLAAPPWLSAQGQGAGEGVGWRGWTKVGAGCSTDPF